MNLPETSGIYLIQREDHIYIGQAQNIKTRIRKHFESLKSNKHKNKHLQNAFNHYGEQSFSVLVLNECKIDELDRYEQEWLDLLREYPKEYVYNQCFEPKTTRGYKFTQEQRLYLSSVNTGKKRSVKFKEQNRINTIKKWQQGIMKTKPKKEFMIVDPNGVIHQVKGLSQFCEYYKLSAGSLHGVITGKIKTCKGYTQFSGLG